MKKLSSMFAVLLAVASVGLATLSDDAFAKRIGGGRSIGKQSDHVTQRQATPPAATANTNTPQAASPAAQAGGLAGAAAQPARNRWLAPLAGVAAGLGLAALASHFGFGEQFGSMMTIILFAMIALFAFRFFMSRRQAAASPMRPAYAGGYSQTQVGAEASVQRFQPLQTGGDAAPLAPASAAAASVAPVVLPAGFDAEGFLRQAKMHFIRLQASFDAANLNDLREFTSPEMFAELQLEIHERKGAANKTEVLQLDGEVLGVHSNSIEHMASVRFQGSLREQEGADPVRIDEVWNLTKPLSGAGGWVLAGIQQLS